MVNKLSVKESPVGEGDDIVEIYEEDLNQVVLDLCKKETE